MQDLSNTEAEVLYLLTKEFLTPRQITIRRKTSRIATYKIIQKLKKKGILNPNLKEVNKFQSTCKPQPKNMIRLHGEEFNIKLLFKDNRYKEQLSKFNTLNIDGNTIRLYNDSLEIYSGQMFFGETAQKATARSIEYWNKFFIRLENDLNIILVKPRYQNIRRVNAHYGETSNELAKDTEERGEKIKIYTTDEGKLWFLIDNSFNLHEAETVHPKTSYGDMQDKIQPFFNDIRDNPPATISDILKLMKVHQLQDNEIAAGLNAITMLFKNQYPQQKKEPEEEFKGKPDYVG